MQGLRAAQPEGFGPGDVFKIGSVTARVPINRLKSDPITVRELFIDDVLINVIKTSNGLINLTSLGPTEKKEPSTSGPPTIVVERIVATNLTISYQYQLP